MKSIKMNAITNEQDYSYRWININYYLHMMSQECRTGQAQTAQNTLEDLRHEWLYQDVLAKTSNNGTIAKYHYPSNSLIRLDSLLSNEKEDVHYLKTVRQILLEIKRINDKMDSMLSHMHQGGIKR